MKKTAVILTAGAMIAAVAALGTSLYLWTARSQSAQPGADAEKIAIHNLQAEVAALRKELSRTAAALEPGSALGSTSEENGNARTAADAIELAKRVQSLETELKSLKSAMDGVSIEKASAERTALFAGPEGYLKADEYFEAGKFAIAGEGYLTFVQNNPDHADVRGVLKKARDAFLKAGYTDKAFWVNGEMMKSFPQHRANDLWEQATLEKDAGLYADAARHAAEAAELSTTSEERLWRRSYWAWYVKLRDGNDAGVAALRQVQQEIAAAGFDDKSKLATKAQEKLVEWQK